MVMYAIFHEKIKVGRLIPWLYSYRIVYVICKSFFQKLVEIQVLGCKTTTQELTSIMVKDSIGRQIYLTDSI